MRKGNQNHLLLLIFVVSEIFDERWRVHEFPDPEKRVVFLDFVMN